MASQSKKTNTNGNTNGKGKGRTRTKKAQEASVSQYHLELSAEYLQLTLYKDAYRCATRALELDPKLLVARVRRGMARKNLGLLDAALADFDTVLSIDPGSVRARELRDEILLAKQRGREERDSTTLQDDAITKVPSTSERDDHQHDEDSEDNDAASTSSSNAESEEEEGEEDDDDADIMVNSEEKPSEVVVDYTLPHYHTFPVPPPSSKANGTQKTENELDHIGNGTACRFYNHNGCNRGTTCTFSHAADFKSIRDERGKNVCLYYLIGKCKWDNQSCIYSHSKTFLNASIAPTCTSSDSASDSPPPFTLSTSFAPFASTPAARPTDGDPEGWWNIPERMAQVRELVLKRDENGRLAHEARVASFNAHTKNKRGKKKNNSKSTPPVPQNLDALFKTMRMKYYDSSDFDGSDYSFDTDLEEELQMEQRYLNGGFTDDEVMELLCQGVKPWDDDAGTVLAALSGEWW